MLSALKGLIADLTGSSRPAERFADNDYRLAATALLATVGPGMLAWGFTLIVVGVVAFESACVYYNSYLPRIASPAYSST